MNAQDPALILTIDIGSSSIRANLYTAEALQLLHLESQLSYGARVTPEGGVEIDPRMLLDLILEAVDSTMERAGERARHIRAVGVCSLVGNVMGVDASGSATTPIYTWADTRCAGEVSELRASLDEREVHERTGCPLHSSYLPARLLWLRRSNPEAYERTSLWVSLGEWLQLHLFGEAAQSLSVASWNGLLNRHSLDWDDPLLQYLKLDRARLPRLVDVDEPLRALRAEYAQRWPSLRGVPWYPCIADGATGNVGSGCIGEDEIAVQVGTSGAMRALVPGAPASVPWGLWCYRLDRSTSILGGALSEGGNVLAWLNHLLAVEDRAALAAAAAGLPPDSHGLTFLPFLAGERSPGWDDSARGVISGLSLHTGGAHLLRAAQEAIAYRFGAIYNLLNPALPPARAVVASGGALLNVEGWVAMLSDVLNTPVTASAEEEASSRGTALLALRSLGLLPDLHLLSASLSTTHHPNPAHHAIYRSAMQRQEALYQGLGSRG